MIFAATDCENVFQDITVSLPNVTLRRFSIVQYRKFIYEHVHFSFAFVIYLVITNGKAASNF